MKLIHFAIIGAIMASTPANALEYFDDLERYAEGEGVATGNGWSVFFPGYDEGQGGPVTRNTTLGITPFSGNRMIELRAPSFGGGNAIRPRTWLDTSEFPGFEYSVKIAVSSQEFVGQTAAIRSHHGGGTYSVSFDFSTGICSFQPEFGNGSSLLVPNIKDRWLDVTFRYNKANRAIAAFIDGELVGEGGMSPNANALSQCSISVGQPANLVSTYPRSIGTPGIFIDDWSNYSVPEPASILALGGAALGLGLKKKRHDC